MNIQHSMPYFHCEIIHLILNKLQGIYQKICEHLCCLTNVLKNVLFPETMWEKIDTKLNVSLYTTIGC